MVTPSQTKIKGKAPAFSLVLLSVDETGCDFKEYCDLENTKGFSFQNKCMLGTNIHLVTSLLIKKLVTKSIITELGSYLNSICYIKQKRIIKIWQA